MPDSVSSRRRSATHRFNALFLAAPALALALMGVAAPAAAQDYRVEVVLFEHLRSRPPGNGQFLFPSSRSGVSLDTERAAAAGFEPYTGVLDLAEHADRMASSGRYRILRQIAWVQPTENLFPPVPRRPQAAPRNSPPLPSTVPSDCVLGASCIWKHGLYIPGQTRDAVISYMKVARCEAASCITSTIRALAS